MDAVNDRAIEGHGTTEADWLGWSGLAAARLVTLDDLVPPGRRAVVVAPHPDDEVLAAGGLIALLAQRGRTPLLIAVTDGTASHEGSTDWPADRLARERPRESEAALQVLGVPDGALLRLGFPDGGLRADCERLADTLHALLRPDDVVFTTWRLDGHPDHEATGDACAEATRRCGASLVEIPVWAWHWSRPADPRLPWTRACQLWLDDTIVERKRDAVQCFHSQLVPDASTGQAPILRPTTVQRANRPFELMFI